METILITGGAGMIGSNLAKRLVAERHNVIVVDNLWRGKLDNLKDDKGNYILDIKQSFYNVDLTKEQIPDELIRRADYIYHLADIVSGIGYVFNNQGSIFRQNLLINSNVINQVRDAHHSIKGLIYVGTACSFPLHRQNTVNAIPLREEELYPAMPESSYGWSKLMGQYEIELLEKETGISCSTLMLHNVYGPPCDYGPRSQVIPALIKKAINFPNEEFVVWGSGMQGRAFVHVDDVVEALICAKEAGLGKGVIQIGPSVCTSIREIAEIVVKLSRKNIIIKYDTSKPEGDKARCADFSKAKRLLNWEPRVSIEQGLQNLYKWMLNQELLRTGGLHDEKSLRT